MRAVLVMFALSGLACAALPQPEPAAPLTPEEKYLAWRKAHNRRLDRPIEGGSTLGEFQFFFVRGNRRQHVDRVAISPTTMLNGGEPGDWRALLRSGDVDSVHARVGWLRDVEAISPGDITARTPPLAPYYTPPTLVTAGEITTLVGWYQEFPSDTSTLITVVAGPDNEVDFEYTSLDEIMAAAP